MTLSPLTDLFKIFNSSKFKKINSKDGDPVILKIITRKMPKKMGWIVRHFHYFHFPFLFLKYTKKKQNNQELKKKDEGCPSRFKKSGGKYVNCRMKKKN